MVGDDPIDVQTRIAIKIATGSRQMIGELLHVSCYLPDTQAREPRPVSAEALTDWRSFNAWSTDNFAVGVARRIFSSIAVMPSTICPETESGDTTFDRIVL